MGGARGSDRSYNHRTILPIICTLSMCLFSLLRTDCHLHSHFLIQLHSFPIKSPCNSSRSESDTRYCHQLLCHLLRYPRDYCGHRRVSFQLLILAWRFYKMRTKSIAYKGSGGYCVGDSPCSWVSSSFSNTQKRAFSAL